MSTTTATIAVSIYDGKARFSEIVDRAGKGETIVITKHGHPIAKLVPFDDEAELRRRHAEEAVARIRERRKGATLGPDLTLRELIEEGRRY